MRKLHVAMVTFKEHYPIVWKHWPKKFRRQAVQDFLVVQSKFYGPYERRNIEYFNLK